MNRTILNVSDPLALNVAIGPIEELGVRELPLLFGFTGDIVGGGEIDNGAVVLLMVRVLVATATELLLLVRKSIS